VRKERKRLLTLGVTIALLLGMVYVPMGNEQGKVVKAASKKTKAYILSKGAGTYRKKVKVRIKARKGYKVYYSINGKFSTKKLIKSGKSKKITIKKTTKLYIYAVKKSKKITAPKLKKKATRKKAHTYVYKIKKNVTVTETPKVTSAPTPTVLPGNEPQPEKTDGNLPGQGGSVTGTPEDVQNEIDEVVDNATTMATPTPTKAPITTDDTTPTISLSKDGESVENATTGVSVSEEDGMRVVEVSEAGTYVFSGGTSEFPLENTVIEIAKNVEGDVNLVLDDLHIDNSAMGTIEEQDRPVIEIGKGTTSVTLVVSGNSSVVGNGNYTTEPASGIIYAKGSDTVMTLMAEDNSASLTVTDAMPKDAEYGENDPTDGIFCKGTLILQSGTYSVTSNGDCLKATGEDGIGGVTILNGDYTLNSRRGNGIRSKDGVISINGGTIKTTYTKEDGINAKNYAVNISGGAITIEKCYGDGIQGEKVNIGGSNTVLNISTYYEYAGKNFYNTALGSGNYNILNSSDTRKVETINVDTGSHKAIKAGTKSCTYVYESVEDGSENVAGTTYTTAASGGVVITGGLINLDTTNTGIKYNGGRNGNGNLAAATSEGQVIVGCPEDAIHSNNTVQITGGTITINSADDGITAPAELTIANASRLKINTCYEGMESGNILIGSSSGVTSAPVIEIYSNDDGVNASSKSSIHYKYTDESEEVYTKTELSSSNNKFTMLSGYLNVMIGDDQTHSFSLPIEGGEMTSSTYSSDGDGIDCNGSFYAYGGTLIVFGSTSGANSPVDANDVYYVGEGVTLFVGGSNGMNENPTSIGQASVTLGSASGGMGGGPGGGGRPGQSSQSGSSVSKGAFLGIKSSDGTTVLALKAPKNISYVLYSSPELVSGTSYTLYSGGTATAALYGDFTYDCRYTGYSSEGATTMSTVTA